MVIFHKSPQGNWGNHGNIMGISWEYTSGQWETHGILEKYTGILVISPQMCHEISSDITIKTLELYKSIYSIYIYINTVYIKGFFWGIMRI